MALTRIPDAAAARRRLAGLRAGQVPGHDPGPGAGREPDPGAGDGTGARQPVDGWRADRTAVETVLRSDGAAAEDACAALTLVTALRADLDRAEQRLIARARQSGASWRDIAAALGLRSRQAAEQRWLRLRAATSRDPAVAREHRHRQRAVDHAAGPAVAKLRAEVDALHGLLVAVPDRPGTAGKLVDLARSTLGAAADAPPGGLLDLARLALRDLAAVPAAHLGLPVVEALRRLSARAEAADPTRRA